MQVNRRLFPEIILDNEEVYFSHLEGVIDSVDEYANLEIVKSPDSYHFRLAPSLPKYNNMLLEEILKLHNLFHIRLDMGKSIKASGTLSFSISLS